MVEGSGNKKAAFCDGLQVGLVSDLQKSLAYYRDVPGCGTSGWGHANEAA
ncbi:hypothetical protein [Paenibacillus hemerocallicola]|nr:hypothetical protein [Paenibacillus hemerocallicola]